MIVSKTTTDLIWHLKGSNQHFASKYDALYQSVLSFKKRNATANSYATTKKVTWAH